MRPAKEITSAEENPREVEFASAMFTIKRDGVEPEPVGTIVLIPFRVTGYDPDCDGSLMARLEAIDKDGEPTGWEQNAIGLHPDSTIVIAAEELVALWQNDSI